MFLIIHKSRYKQSDLCLFKFFEACIGSCLFIFQLLFMLVLQTPGQIRDSLPLLGFKLQPQQNKYQAMFYLLNMLLQKYY